MILFRKLVYYKRCSKEHSQVPSMQNYSPSLRKLNQNLNWELPNGNRYGMSREGVEKPVLCWTKRERSWHTEWFLLLQEPMLYISLETLCEKNTWNWKEKETQVNKFTKIILYYYQTNYLEMATKSPILYHSFVIDI